MGGENEAGAGSGKLAVLILCYRKNKTTCVAGMKFWIDKKLCPSRIHRLSNCPFTIR